MPFLKKEEKMSKNGKKYLKFIELILKINGLKMEEIWLRHEL